MPPGTEPNILVCRRVRKRERPPLEGAWQAECVDCGKRVWVSESGLRAGGIDAIIVCMHCFRERVVNDPDPTMLPPTAEQMADVMNEVARRRWGRG